MSKRFLITLVVFLAFLVLLAAGFGAYILLRPEAMGLTSSAAQATAQAGPDAAFYFETKNFVTNLADTDRPRYVDTTIALALEDAPTVEIAKKIEPVIRDTVLRYLRLRTVSDLAGAAGAEKLSAALQPGLNDLLGGRLIKVYVTDLTVQ